jgi:SNF2 family DNA or RNA helicase
MIFKTIKILKSSHRLALTGTPIENNVMELWSMMHFLNHNLLGGPTEFKKKYARPIESDKDQKLLEKLRNTVYPFILRRKKEDVEKDLPKKEEIILYLEMEEKQKRFYENLCRFFNKKINVSLNARGVSKSMIRVLEALLRLRQAALAPELLSPKYSKIPSSKLLTLEKMIVEIVREDHKILIFSQFVKILKMIEVFVKEKGIKYSYLDGSTKDRNGQINEFQNNKEVKIFLISLKAGGVGINLTAADYVFLFDPWWNPAVENQAIDRSHRIGQKRNVMVYKMYVKNTIEEKIMKLQESKRNIADQLISTDKSLIKSLSREDILGLLS